MATKSCPSCGADVPVVASRCKHCFFDFTADAAESKKSNAIVSLLGFIFVLLLIGAGTAYSLAGSQKAEKVVIDQETRSIIYTRTSASGTETERVNFDQIEKVKHIIGGEDAMYEVIAVGTNGKDYLLKLSPDENLNGDGAHLAKVMGKPFEEISTIPGKETIVPGMPTPGVGGAAGTPAPAGAPH